MKRLLQGLVAAIVLLGALCFVPNALAQTGYDCTFAVDGFSCTAQTSLPPAPVEPPASTFIVIPPVPFDWDKPPGAVTMTGPLPSSIGAGEVLQLSPTVNSVRKPTFTCNGTEQSPAFILGGSITGPANGVFNIEGSWCIFDGTVFNDSAPKIAGHNIVFRNIEAVNSVGKNGMALIGSNIVVANSEIHHNQGDDRHGIFVGSGSDGIWIFNNHVHHNGGDGFQACHRCSANPPKNIYLGGNLFHSDRENGIDFKYIENVIVEGNTIHSLVSAPKDVNWCFDDGSKCAVFSSGSDGAAIVVGSDGGPTSVQIINNEIYNTNKAVRLEEGVNISLVGNNFHDVGTCFQLDKSGFDTVYSRNACSDSVRGIAQQWRSNFSLTVDGNTFINLSGPSIEYESRSVADASTLTNNIFSNSGPVIHGRSTYTTESEINASAGASGNTVN